MSLEYVLIPLAAMALAFGAGIAYILFSRRPPPDFSTQRSKANQSLGEYGRLKARLADLDKPYLKRGFLETSFDRVAAVVAVIANALLAFWIQEQYGTPAALLVVALALIPSSFGVAILSTALERRRINQKILVWQQTHPEIASSMESSE